MGKAYYYFGKVVALYYTFRILYSAKQMISPKYSEEIINKTVKTILVFLHTADSNEDMLTITITVQYIALAINAMLIIVNVRSFLKQLLITFKNLLKDNEIQLSYQNTLLSLSFIMGSYYLSIILQMSMNLPVT